MISSSLKEMTKGRLREFLREPSAFFFVIMMPVIWMLILGFAFSGPQKTEFLVGLVTTPQDAGVESVFANDEAVSLKKGLESELLLLLKRKKIHLLIEPQASGLTFHFDPSLEKSQFAMLYLKTRFIAQGGVEAAAIKEAPLTTFGSRYIDFLIPGLLALSLLSTSLFGTGMTLVANRREGLLKRYCATPMKSWEYIGSHILGRFVIMCVEMMVVFCAGFFFFGFSPQASWISVCLFSVLVTASFTAIGILFGSRVKNTSAYSGLVNLVTLVMMMLSGVWFSVDGFPIWLVSISNLMPLSAAVNGLRALCLEGASIFDLVDEISTLLLYFIGSTAAALRIFKWY